MQRDFNLELLRDLFQKKISLDVIAVGVPPLPHWKHLNTINRCKKFMGIVMLCDVTLI